MSRHPLVAHRRLTDVLAYRRGEPLSVARFLADVRRLAAQFPPSNCVLNACNDRYRFTVGLAAALVERKVTVLPANLAPGTVAHLRQLHPELFALLDAENATLDLPRLFFRDDVVPGETPEDAAIPEIHIDQPLAWLFTSGSTGLPVPHLKRWGALVRSTAIETARLGLQEIPRAAIVATVPPQHSYGLESSVMVALQGGAALSAARPFYPLDICDALAEVPRPRLLVSTPFHLRLLLDAGVSVPAIDVVVSATAPLPFALAEEVESRLGARLIEIYGSTDTGQIASRRPCAGAPWTLFDGVCLSPGAGETWASGGHVGGPVSLPDVVEMIDEQHFLLHGRSADLVNVAGKRSSIAYLTHQLTAIPGVDDGIFFMPDEAPSGAVTRLAALVVAPGLTAEQLVRSLRERVDPVFLPRPLVFVDALPRNATGKLPREAVRKLVETRGRPAAER